MQKKVLSRQSLQVPFYRAIPAGNQHYHAHIHPSPNLPKWPLGQTYSILLYIEMLVPSLLSLFIYVFIFK